MGSFYEKVWLIAREIPTGRVTSYGAIARFVGTGLSARMVGYAMNKSFQAVPGVPAHRVVNRNGLLTGKIHFPTPTLMEELLAQEGVEVIDDQVQNFSACFWDPADHLDPESWID